MEMSTIGAPMLAKMFLAGAKNLESKKEWINELNVFPVPDGDTGTNMTMTIQSAAKEVEAIEDLNMRTLAKAISSGSLRGARGNSGVILSQLLRGFTKAIKEVDEVDVDVLCEALQRAVETAYKAVMKPKEGTILTVAKGAADKALELVDTTDDIVAFIDAVIAEADYVLSKTPDMLPVLKQAGVVDSGGQGLVQVMKGAYDCLLGKDVDYEIAENETPQVKYLYCVSFTATPEKPLSDKTVSDYRGYLESLGDEVVVVSDNTTITSHLHTNDPGLILQKALSFGTIHAVSIHNVLEEKETCEAGKLSEKAAKQASEKTADSSAEEPAAEASEEAAAPEKEMGFVAVSIGEGLGEIFRELGVDTMIEGGQTMNPSTEDVLDAIAKVPAKTVFVLPNNKNIILAANQAASLCEDKEVIVLPTKTIPQGITALINFIPEQSAKENEERMVEEIANVKTGQVTYAVRDTVIDDKEITQGDYMGIGDAGILSVNKDITTAFLDMIGEMMDEDAAIVSIYYGEDVTEEDASKLADAVTAKYADLEVELQAGGQPVYYYIASVE